MPLSGMARKSPGRVDPPSPDGDGTPSFFRGSLLDYWGLKAFFKEIDA